MKKSLFITIAFLLLASMTFAQSAKLNRANRLFEKGNYEKAVVLYQKAFEKEKRRIKSKIILLKLMLFTQR